MSNRLFHLIICIGPFSILGIQVYFMFFLLFFSVREFPMFNTNKIDPDNAEIRGIWSGSILFAYPPFLETLDINELIGWSYVGLQSFQPLLYPASILYKSIAGRYGPVSYPDGPIMARYRFIKNAYWEVNKVLSSYKANTCVAKTACAGMCALTGTCNYLTANGPLPPRNWRNWILPKKVLN